ncbi:unnamed protein product, partial [Timema podura]|nr:unnamed protein product [Timema podura]
MDQEHGVRTMDMESLSGPSGFGGFEDSSGPSLNLWHLILYTGKLGPTAFFKHREIKAVQACVYNSLHRTVNDDPQNVFIFLDGMVCCLPWYVLLSCSKML